MLLRLVSSFVDITPSLVHYSLSTTLSDPASFRNLRSTHYVYAHSRQSARFRPLPTTAIHQLIFRKTASIFHYVIILVLCLANRLACAMCRSCCRTKVLDHQRGRVHMTLLINGECMAIRRLQKIYI